MIEEPSTENRSRSADPRQPVFHAGRRDEIVDADIEAAGDLGQRAERGRGVVALDLAEIADRDAGCIAQRLQRHVQPPAAGADQRADLGLSRCSRSADRWSHVFTLTKIFLI